MGRRPGQEGVADFEAFFDATWARALRMVSRMGLSRQDSEDVVLDSMAIAYDRWARVRLLQNREGWFLKVTTNRALRQLRKATRKDVPEPDLHHSPDEGVAVSVSLRNGIAGLPRRQREVITLRYLADMPEHEVAEVLGLNAGTVKQHASRGRAALRDSLGGIEIWSEGHA